MIKSYITDVNYEPRLRYDKEGIGHNQNRIGRPLGYYVKWTKIIECDFPHLQLQLRVPRKRTVRGEEAYWKVKALEEKLSHR